MIIVLLGYSGSGKSTIEFELATHYGFKKIISYTTRKPRSCEKNEKDYYFIDNDTFNEFIQKNLLAEYDEYSQNRLYGTLKSDYMDDDKVNKVVVLTPNGLRKLKKNCPEAKIFSIFITASLGTRVKRYIDRCDIDKFNFDDMNEINARVNRDFGMFLGLENEVNLIIDNSENTKITDVINIIIGAIKDV